MLRRLGVVFVLAVMFMTAVAAAAIGCSTRHPTSEMGAAAPPAPGAPGDSTGVLGMQLTLSGGAHISQVSYTLTNGTNTLSGSYRVSAASTLSFVIGDVPAGTGYSLFLVANSDDGSVTCSYPAPGDPNLGSIAVTDRATTVVNVNMQCVVGQALDSGSVTVIGSTSNCPLWNTIVANPVNVTLDGGANVNDSGAAGATAIYPSTSPVPASIAVGQSLVLVGSATAPNPGSIAFAWSATGGTLSSFSGTNDPNSTDAGTTNQTTFTCPSTPAVITITMAVSDGPLPDGGTCDSRFTTGQITVDCLAPSACGPFGTGCGDGGQICSLGGTCVPAMFSVLVLNSIDGGIIDNHATLLPMSIQTYSLAGPQGSALPLPITTGGNVDAGPISLQGNFTVEGDLTTSADGQFLVVMGWNSTAGGKANTSPAIATVGVDGGVVTTVVPDAFQTSTNGGLPTSYRSVVSTNGHEFWISGTDSDMTPTSTAGGIWYVPPGIASGCSTSVPPGGSPCSSQLVAFPMPAFASDPNLGAGAVVDRSPRWLRIFDGQLYSGTDYDPPGFLVTVGTGLPRTAGQIPARVPLTLPAAPDGGAPLAMSPYGVVMFDLVPPGGPDTMYVADDGMNNIIENPLTPSFNNGFDTGGAGLSKWVLSGTTWTRVWNLTDGNFADAGSGVTTSNQPMGFRGLAGYATGTLVTLMTTTGDVAGSPDSIAVVLQDNGTSTSSTPPTLTTLPPIPTTPLSQVFRGVALTPQ